MENLSHGQRRFQRRLEERIKARIKEADALYAEEQPISPQEARGLVQERIRVQNEVIYPQRVNGENGGLTPQWRNYGKKMLPKS